MSPEPLIEGTPYFLNILAISKDCCKYYSRLIDRKHPPLKRCFAFIDGLKIPVNVASKNEYVSLTQLQEEVIK